MDSQIRTSTVVQPVVLKLLVTWVANCPEAVHCFLDSRPRLTFLLELVSRASATVCMQGLTAVLLGECTLYNTSGEYAKDPSSVMDLISQKIGLTSYMLKFDKMQRSNVVSASKMRETRKTLTRSNAVSVVNFEDIDDGISRDKINQDSPFLSFIFEGSFVEVSKGLKEKIRKSIIKVYSHPKSKVAVVPAEFERRLRKLTRSVSNGRSCLRRSSEMRLRGCLDVMLRWPKNWQSGGVDREQKVCGFRKRKMLAACLGGLEGRYHLRMSSSSP